MPAAGAHVTLATGEEIVLDRDYLSAGWLDYGYASSVHTAQGITCDHVLVVGPAGLYREAVYVAMSRARLSAWVYGTTTEALDFADRHTTGIPLPGERVSEPEHELIDRVHLSGAEQLVSSRDTEAARIADLAAEVPAVTLLALAQQVRHAQRVAEHEGHANPADLRVDLDRAVTFRLHAEVGRRARALDRDNVGHVIALDDNEGTCDVLFVNDQGRSATRTMAWSELVVIDQPEPTTLTPESKATLGRIADDVERAAREWSEALATHGVESGDADRLQRAANVACDRAAHRLRADPPEWLTNWLGPRPTDGPGAAVWDDSIARTATHRVVHEIDDTTPGLGPQPLDPAAAAVWQELMLRTLRDRVWLTDRQHEPQPIHPAMPATAMHDTTGRTPGTDEHRTRRPPRTHRTSHRRQRRLCRSPRAPRSSGQRTAGAAGLDRRQLAPRRRARATQRADRRPASPRPLADGDASGGPGGARRHGERRVSPPVARHRTLAALDQEAAANDPVRQAEAKVRDLDRLAARASTNAEQTAVDEALRAARLELRQARREQRVDGVFARYGAGAHADAVERRLLTVGYDVLTEPPEWVVEHLRRLDDDGRLGTTRVADLATRVVDGAVYLDRHGHLPASWAEVGLRAATREVPVVEIGVPEL